MRCAPGTAGRRSGIPEYELTLKIALQVRTLLLRSGAEVVMTREENRASLSNRERAVFANRAEVDVCVKLHCDGARRGLRMLSRFRRGVLTLVPASGCLADPGIVEPSATAAWLIHNRAVAASGLRDRGIEERTDLTGFNWSLVPVLLIEMGNLTYPVEERKLLSVEFQRDLAYGIASGVEGALERCL